MQTFLFNYRELTIKQNERSFFKMNGKSQLQTPLRLQMSE